MGMRAVADWKAVADWSIEYLPSKRGFDSLRGNMRAMGDVRYAIEPLGIAFALPDSTQAFIPHEVMLAYAMAGMAAPSVLSKIATGWIGQAGRIVVDYPSRLRRAVAGAVVAEGMGWVNGVSEEGLGQAVAGGIVLVGGQAVDLSGVAAQAMPMHRAVAWGRRRARHRRAGA
jgi:hypothetical protein